MVVCTQTTPKPREHIPEQFSAWYWRMLRWNSAWRGVHGRVRVHQKKNWKRQGVAVKRSLAWAIAIHAWRHKTQIFKQNCMQLIENQMCVYMFDEVEDTLHKVKWSKAKRWWEWILVKPRDDNVEQHVANCKTDVETHLGTKRNYKKCHVMKKDWLNWW